MRGRRARGFGPESRDDIVVFLDGDGSDIPAFIPQFVEPITRGTHDFVIGSRTRGQRETGSMNFQQILSGRIAGGIMQLLYGVRYTDMCPFRAIRRDALAKLDMREETYGWNLEMQMKAARAGLRILEIPVNHRCRTGGESKVSGTLRGTFVAGTRIIATLFRVAISRQGVTAPQPQTAETARRLWKSVGSLRCNVGRWFQCSIWKGSARRRLPASRLNF